MTGRSSPMLPTVEYVFEDGSDSASQVPSEGRHRLSVTSTASARSSRGAVEAAMSLISTTAESSRTRPPRAIEAEAECSDHVRHVPMGPNPPPTEDLAQYPTEASSTAPVQAAPCRYFSRYRLGAVAPCNRKSSRSSGFRDALVKRSQHESSGVRGTAEGQRQGRAGRADRAGDRRLGSCHVGEHLRVGPPHVRGSDRFRARSMV